MDDASGLGSNLALSSTFLRRKKDISELSVPSACRITSADGEDDTINLQLYMTPKEGSYRGIKIVFAIHVGPDYPFEPPTVVCKRKVLKDLYENVQKASHDHMKNLSLMNKIKKLNSA